MTQLRRKDGFAGQKFLVPPRDILNQAAQDPLVNSLYITDFGCFPHAQYHYIDRPKGVEQYVLIYCIDGQGWYKLNRRRRNVASGQFFMLPAGLPHRYGADENNPWTIYWFHFAGSNARYFYDKAVINTSKFNRNVTNSNKIISLFETINSTLEKGYSKQNICYSGLCLHHLLALFIFPQHVTDASEHTKDKIESAIEFMRGHLNQSLTLTQIAKHVQLSESHFSNVFKNTTGYSPIDYHTRLRMQMACQLFDSTDMMVKQVAYELGYHDPYYFSRLFSKIIGKAPYSYKKEQLAF